MATIAARPGLITRIEQQTERKCRECQNSFIPRRVTQGVFCSKLCKYKNGRRNYRGVKEGYVWIYPDVDKYPVAHDYPGVTKDGRILEHRYIMQEHLARPLTKSETVHHINGNKDDNDISNLELWSSRHPKGVRDSKCPHCGGGL